MLSNFGSSRVDQCPCHPLILQRPGGSGKDKNEAENT